jgi:hypothetical protein
MKIAKLTPTVGSRELEHPHGSEKCCDGGSDGPSCPPFPSLQSPLKAISPHLESPTHMNIRWSTLLLDIIFGR